MNSAAEFVKNNPNTTAHASYFLTKYKDGFTWSDSEDMLEIGCATGISTYKVLHAFVGKHLKHLIGGDISREAISIASKRYTKPNLSFVQMDISDEKVGREYCDKFGHIFAFYCFHTVRPTEAWMSNVYKMLKKNGQMFATIVLSPNHFTKIMLAQKMERNPRWIKYLEEYPDLFVDFGPNSVEAISEDLRCRGFTIDRIGVEPKRFVFSNPDNLQSTLCGANNIVHRLPMEMRDDYIEDFKEKESKLRALAGYGCSFVMDILTVLATKH